MHQRRRTTHDIRWGPAIFGCLLLVCAAYAGLLLYFDGERIRETISSQLDERAGLSVRARSVERILSFRPQLRVRGLEIANAMHSDEPLVVVEDARFRVRPWTILFGPITLDDVTIEGLSVYVPVDRSGALYWDPLVDAVAAWFDRFALSLTSASLRDARIERRNVNGRNELAVYIERFDGAVPSPAELTFEASGVHADLATTLPLRTRQQATLDRIVLSRQSGPLPVTLFVTGSIEGEDLVIEAEGGNLLADDRQPHVPLHARLTLGAATARINGTMSADENPHVAWGIEYEEPGRDQRPALRISATLSDPGTSWRFDDVVAAQGESRLDASLLIENRDGRRRYSGEATLSGISFPPTEESATQSGQDEKGVAGYLPRGDFVADWFDSLRSADADVRARLEDATIFGVPFDVFELHTTLDQGRLRLNVEESASRESSLSGTLEVDAGAETPAIDIDAELRNLDVSAFIAKVEALAGVEGNFDGEVALQAAGNDAESIIRSTRGYARFYLQDGIMPEPLAERIAGEILSAIFAELDANDTTPIHCVLVDFTVDDGIAQSETLLIDTGEFIINGKGYIDFNEVRVDLRFKPNARDFSLISMRTPFRLHGALDDLAFEADIGEGVESLLMPIEFGNDGDVVCDTSNLSFSNH